jgi:DNA-binding MarR family transcriptional regulator
MGPHPLEESKSEPCVLSIDDVLGYQIRRASVAVMNGFIDTFSSDLVRPVSFSVASVIGDRPGISSAEVCRILGLQRANIVGVLDRLQAEGLLRRVDAPVDQRVQLLHLTDAGSEALHSWKARVNAHEDDLFLRLSSEERQQLKLLLKKIWA